MRRFAVLAGPVAVAMLAFACEDDPEGQGGVQFPEAGTIDTSRPTQSSDARAPDSGTPDGSEADGADAAPAPVTIVTSTRNGPLSTGVTVVFHDATGAVIETKAPGPDGRASSTGATPAMASAIIDDGGLDRFIYTWTAVQAGDVLPVVARLGDPFATLDVSLMAPFGGAVTYDALVGACGNSGDGNAAIPVLVHDSCVRGTGKAVLVHAYDDTLTHVASAFAKGVTVPADGGTAAVTTGAFAAPSDVTFKATSTPGLPPSLAGRLHQIASDTAIPVVANFDPGGTATVKVAPGFADAYQAQIAFPGSDPGSSFVFGSRLLPTATVTIDASQRLAAITGVLLNPANKKRPVITWAAGDLSTSKGGVIRLNRSDGLKGGKRTFWSFVVAPTATTVTAPALPASADALLPSEDAGVNGPAPWLPPWVDFADSDLVADYAAFRKLHGVVLPLLGDPLDIVLPQAGSLRITRYRDTQLRVGPTD